MIREYALQPEVVASWFERKQFGLFVQQFGFGTGRIVSRYPDKWRELVWKAFEANFGKTSGETDKTRMIELLKQLTSPEIKRLGCLWNDARDWLTNAESEHARKPFHAILARDNPRTNTKVMCMKDVLSGTPAEWAVPNSIVVARTAESMAKCVEPMLLCATKVLLIDPHFRAVKPEFNRPLAKFLRVVRDANSQISVELHTADRDEAPNWSTFRQECQRHLPSYIPRGMTLIVRRWQNRPNGERLHNRYILTDIGGVTFGVGLDEGTQGATDDVTLLSAPAYSQRLGDYAGPAYAFDLEGEVKIMGR